MSLWSGATATYIDGPLNSRRILQTIRDSGPLLDKQITHRMPMSNVQEAFDLQIAGQAGKIILHPWES